MTGTRRDLTGLIDPPNRAANLGRLPQHTSTTPAPEHHGATERDESAAEPHRHPRTRRTNPPVDRIPWVVYLPQQIHDAADAARGAMPWSEWVLDAYRHVHTQLDTRPVSDDSGLPPRATSLRRNITRPREKQLKLSAAEINIIESKMETIGESNRSAFITAVVELRLAQLNR